jgi:hypothetical protein
MKIQLAAQRLAARPACSLRGNGKRGNWRIKPPDAESADWGQSPESAAERPHLSGAPNQDRKTAIIFPERNRPAVDDR